MAEDETTPPGVQDRPWWTSGSKFALAFIVASNVVVLLTIFVPEFSHYKDRHLQDAISKSDRNQQRQIAEANQNLEALNRQVEITRLLFDHFFGKSAREQTAVVGYLTYQFPRDLRRKSLQAILVLEAKPGVQGKITTSIASVQKRPVGQSTINVAVAQEKLGFRLLIAGDLAKAKTAFVKAYHAYPTYHNVDEISNRVLTGDRVASYTRNPSARALKETIGIVLTSYSWGIPPALLSNLQKKFASLT